MTRPTKQATISLLDLRWIKQTTIERLWRELQTTLLRMQCDEWGQRKTHTLERDIRWCYLVSRELQDRGFQLSLGL